MARRLYDETPVKPPRGGWENLLGMEKEMFRESARRHLDAIAPLLGSDAAAQKEVAFQAFLAGAEFAGVELEDPERQFAVFWQRRVDSATDAP